MSQAVAARIGRLPGFPAAWLAELGLLLAVALVFVQRTPDLPLVRQALTLSEVVFLGSAGLWLLWVVAARPPLRIYSAGLLAPFLLYLFAALLSLYFSPYDARDVDGVRELLARTYLMAFLLALASYGTSVRSYQRVLLAWGGAAAVVVTLLAVQLTGLAGDRLVDFQGRFIGLFRNPNAAGGALAGTVLCFVPLAFTRGRADSLTLFRTFARFTLPGLLVAVYLTDSQASYLAVLAGLAVWPLIRSARNWGPSLPLLVMVLAVPLIVGVAQVESVSRLVEQVLGTIGYEAGGTKFQARVDMIESRLRAILMHPITGVGLAKAMLSHDPLSAIAAHGTHFTILGIALETGLLGLAAVGLIFVTFLGILRKNASLPLGSYPAWRALNEGLNMAFVGFLIFGLTHDVQTNRLMWLVATLTICFRPAFESEAVESPPHTLRPSRLAWVLAQGRSRS
jgi:hypothetical protein